MTAELWWMAGAALVVVVFGETITRVVPATSSNPEPAEPARAKRHGLYTFEE